jgi:hypothetical protein
VDFFNAYDQGFARVAACTAPVAVADPATNVRTVLEQARACHEDGVAVAVFPELCLSGYAIDDLLLQDTLLDAVRDAGNRWVFTEQLAEGGGSLERWDGVGEVWAFGSPQSTHAVDTTATFDAGVASLEAHRAYIDGLGWEHFDPREFLEGMARATGQRLGCAFAAPFEVFPMGWGE